MKNYIGSQEHWEDSINADYELKKRMEEEQNDDRQQNYDIEDYNLQFLTSEWWHGLNLEEKFYNIIPWLKGKGMSATDKHPDDLAECEIIELYKIHLELK